MEGMNALQKSKGSELSRLSEVAEEIMALLNVAKKWGFEISLAEAQNAMGEILEECVGDLGEVLVGERNSKKYSLPISSPWQRSWDSMWRDIRK